MGCCDTCSEPLGVGKSAGDGSTEEVTAGDELEEDSVRLNRGLPVAPPRPVSAAEMDMDIDVNKGA